MAAPTPLGSEASENSSPVGKGRCGAQRRWRRLLFLLLIAFGIVATGIILVISRAEPILKTRVIETLSARFKSRVELASLHVFILHGLQVSGSGLQIYGATDPNPYEPGVQPILLVNEFRFSTSLRNLFREPMRVATIYVSGMTINIPPKEDRGTFNQNVRHAKTSIAVGQFVCENTKLLINTSKPGHAPLEFDIGKITMTDIGPGQPFHFKAKLINPKPVGDIQSSGEFGPWQEFSPRDTPVQGDYLFQNADLSTLKGIAGILSSTGSYKGTLGHIEADGETNTPDFRLARTGHPVPLHTDFHAIIDGDNGDTYLDPVKARLLNSLITATGKVVKVESPSGRDIELNVVLDHARIEDLLRLGVKTNPPIMTGPIAMKTRLSIYPGPDDVVDRMKLAGSFQIPAAHFNNEKLQSKIDSLSLRSQGKPRLAHQPYFADVASELKGNFDLNHGLLSFSSLHFLIPGTHADLSGQYSLDGQLFDFHGILKLEAKLSQMTTGWKSILLKPVDPFFKKDGAGTEVPFRVSGSRSSPEFNLDFGRKEHIPTDGERAEKR